ncbi:kynurenine 3-monooxygenase, mitochondrial precursor, partial [Beauveria asiatica]
MIHRKTVSGGPYEVSQDFDALGRTNFAIDRAALNANILDCIDALPNVKLFFNHKLIHVDFHNCTALVEDRDWLSQSVEVKFDIMLGADGAHSAVRYHMMNISRMDYQHEYLDVLWCELRMKPGKVRGDTAHAWKISPSHLHIWPAEDSMFIATANKITTSGCLLHHKRLIDGSFTCTLFMPASRFAALEADESQILPFFDANFPGVRNHISDTSLIRSFSECPHRRLVSIKCKPYHFGPSSVIVGDAAHVMAPFYGQGMNAGMEDVRLLFSVLDKHAHATRAALRGEQGEDDKNNHSPSRAAKIRGRALAEYSASRWRDAHAINDLAMQNYREMRTSQSTLYKLRKALEEFMHATFPSLGWQSKYSRVVFSNEWYAECVRRNDGQDRLLSIFTALCASPLVAAGLYLARARV